MKKTTIKATTSDNIKNMTKPTTFDIINSFLLENNIKVYKADIYNLIPESDSTYYKKGTLLDYKSTIVSNCNVASQGLDRYLTYYTFDNFVMEYENLELVDCIVMLEIGYVIPKNKDYVPGEICCCVYYHYKLVDLCHTLTLKPYITLIEGGAVCDNDISRTFTILSVIGEYFSKKNENIIKTIHYFNTGNFSRIIVNIVKKVFQDRGESIPEEIINITKQLNGKNDIIDQEININIPLFVYSAITAHGRDKFDHWCDYDLLFPEYLWNYTGTKLYNK